MRAVESIGEKMRKYLKLLGGCSVVVALVLGGVWVQSSAYPYLGVEYFFISDKSRIDCRQSAAVNAKSEKALEVMMTVCEEKYPITRPCKDEDVPHKEWMLCIDAYDGRQDVIIQFPTNRPGQAWKWYWQTGVMSRY